MTANILDHLDGKLLLAMPGMSDPRFKEAVIYICAHSSDGAMGLIVNKPAQNIEFSKLLMQLGITPVRPLEGIHVHFGGPVEHGRGFILHSCDYNSESETLKVNDMYGMTASFDILEDISNGEGPEKCLLALGYTGWGPGQLEAELRENGWLVSDAPHSIVFSKQHRTKWHDAIKSIGVDPRLLSVTGGRA